jgi:rare lipoprotein A
MSLLANHLKYSAILCSITLLLSVSPGSAEEAKDSGGGLLTEIESPARTNLEELVLKGSPLGPVEGVASYYARRFEGRRTTSGHRYNPEKLTAAHHSLPLGTVVRVVNPANSQEVHVTINDRCARKPFPFIDLSRAAAKKIGLWGKGKIKVVIIPLLEERLKEEPA